MMSYDNSALPPGWEARYDFNLGKTYYLNHNDKITSWDHPCKNKKTTPSRSSNKQSNGTPKHFTSVAVEHIPLQHGSPDLKRNYVYPSQPSPIPAFQVSPHQSPKINILQDLSNKTRGSPLTVRSKLQDTSLTNPIDTDEAVSKIAAMFPTVSDAHIRLLMKKYHNREVLVISALQVEKNPITTPGPFATPPPQRNHLQSGQHVPLHMTPPLGVRQTYSRGGSPILRGGSGPSSIYTGSPRVGEGFRTSRPQSSPKLKLRYMKSIFPQAEETIILDVLTNNDNNIQKTSEKLKELGFDRKDDSKTNQQKQINQKVVEIKPDPPKSPVPIPKIKTAEEKEKIKISLQKDHQDIPEQLINIALESVDFDKDKASDLLKSTTDDKVKVQEGKIIASPENENEGIVDCKEFILPISQSRQSLKSLLKTDRNDKDKTIFNRVIDEYDSCQKSGYLSNTKGANPTLAQGNNEKLLLEDYINWQGPNPVINKGPQKSLAKGPNSSYKIERQKLSCGSNSAYCKGPNKSLVKGSIFQQIKVAVAVGCESRGK